MYFNSPDDVMTYPEIYGIVRPMRIHSDSYPWHNIIQLSAQQLHRFAVRMMHDVEEVESLAATLPIDEHLTASEFSKWVMTSKLEIRLNFRLYALSIHVHIPLYV